MPPKYTIEHWNTPDEKDFIKTLLEVLEIDHHVWTTDFICESRGITVEDIEKEFRPQEDVIRDWLKSKDEMERSRLGLLVRNETGEIVGYSISHKNDTTVKIGIMYILEPFRHIGVGSALMKRIIEWKGDKRLWLMVIAYNYPAIKFYESQGFKISSDVAKPLVLKCGKEIPQLYMDYMK